MPCNCIVLSTIIFSWFISKTIKCNNKPLGRFVQCVKEKGISSFLVDLQMLQEMEFRYEFSPQGIYADPVQYLCTALSQPA